MSLDTGCASGDACADVFQEQVVLDAATSCEADAVSDIVGRAVRRFLPAEPSDGFIQGVMQGVVRSTIGTHMDPRQAARGAITGIMRAVCPVPGSPNLAAFTSAARSLILETSAMGGQLDATVRGILDAAFSDASTGLTWRQVMTVVSMAILDATMESIGQPLRKGGTSAWNEPRRAGDDDGRSQQARRFRACRMKSGTGD